MAAQAAPLSDLAHAEVLPPATVHTDRRSQTTRREFVKFESEGATLSSRLYLAPATADHAIMASSDPASWQTTHAISLLFVDRAN